jgi:two-component system, LytTR family, sensor kinase
VALVLLGFTGTSLYLFFKRNLEKRKRVQSELAALRNQLNPHFVFNSLTSLQHFIIENQRSLAIDYLTKFAVLMRMILENSKQETISIEEEKKFLELYLYMEASRFEYKFGIKINVDPALNEREVNIPPMLLQPVVENAIKHGLVAKKNDGKIEVSFLKRNNKSILCVVEDNGVGRKRAMESKAKSNIVHQSRSTEIINEKLQLIGTGRKNKNKLNYIDLYDVSGNAIGTRAELEIPINS